MDTLKDRNSQKDISSSDLDRTSPHVSKGWKSAKKKQTKLEIFQLFVLMMLSALAAESTEEES